MIERPRILYFATAFYALLLVLVSVAPKGQLPKMSQIPMADKWGHALAYAIFAVLLYHSLRQVKRPFSQAIVLALLIAASFGILMEYAQYALNTGRYFETWDMLANVVGALLALILIWLFNFFKPKPLSV